jgi:hypothetical protein
LFIPICLSGEHLRTAIQIHNTTVSKAIAQIIFPSPVPFNALAEGDIFLIKKRNDDGSWKTKYKVTEINQHMDVRTEGLVIQGSMSKRKFYRWRPG